MSLNFAVKDKKTNLEYIIEKELFIICPPLPTDQFVSYCKDHGVKTSRNQLEQFEKLGIFYPFLRIKYPKIKTKIKYIDNSNESTRFWGQIFIIDRLIYPANICQH